jgi:hypothetical protein
MSRLEKRKSFRKFGDKFSSAKGALQSPAWGIAPGIQSSMNAALKARFRFLVIRAFSAHGSLFH